MRHQCKNFIADMQCTKYRTPEWALHFPEFKHKIGSKVKIPRGYTNEGKVFFVLRRLKNNGYVIGISKDNPIESYAWWEIYPIKEVKPNSSLD